MIGHNDGEYVVCPWVLPVSLIRNTDSAPQVPSSAPSAPVESSWPDFSCAPAQRSFDFTTALAALARAPKAGNLDQQVARIVERSAADFLQRWECHGEVRKTLKGAQGVNADLIALTDVVGECISVLESTGQQFKHLYRRHQLRTGIQPQNETKDGFEGLIEGHSIVSGLSALGILSQIYMMQHLGKGVAPELHKNSSQIIDKVHSDLFALIAVHSYFSTEQRVRDFLKKDWQAIASKNDKSKASKEDPVPETSEKGPPEQKKGFAAYAEASKVPGLAEFLLSPESQSHFSQTCSKLSQLADVLISIRVRPATWGSAAALFQGGPR